MGSFLQNVIQSLAPGSPYFDGYGQRLNSNVIRNQPGQSISTFYSYQVIGLWNNAEEIKGADALALVAAKAAVKDPTSVTATTFQDGEGLGRFRYADLNGDGRITDADRTFLGSPVPKFTGGATLTLRYKGFDLTGYLYTSPGNKIFNNSKWYTDFYPSFPGAAISARVLDSWTPANTNTSQPIFEGASNFSTNTVANSFYVENGSYLRLRYVSLGYNLPASALSAIGLKHVRFSLSANNLFTITGYKGLDPAVGGAADTNFGVDIGNYPVTHGYNTGLNITF